MLQTIPYWVNLRDLKPIRFYRYKSSTINRFFEISTWRKEEKKKYKEQLEFFESFKRKVLRYKVLVDNKKYQIRWDNKVVIECKVKGVDNTIFIGCFDETWSIGLGRCGDKVWEGGLEMIR